MADFVKRIWPNPVAFSEGWVLVNLVRVEKQKRGTCVYSIFELAYINTVRGFHCDNSIHVLWASPPLHCIPVAPSLLDRVLLHGRALSGLPAVWQKVLIPTETEVNLFKMKILKQGRYYSWLHTDNIPPPLAFLFFLFGVSCGRCCSVTASSHIEE
jgi:hypothetical protein